MGSNMLSNHAHANYVHLPSLQAPKGLVCPGACQVLHKLLSLGPQA